MPGWLRAKLLEQPENTTVEDLCIFARKQLSIHNLCKTDDSVMDAFSEMGPSVTDTLVFALTKLSRNSRLKSLLQILITCLIHNKLRSPVINVAILIT